MAELDAEQRLAVEAGPVDLFISAGAGSGKTRVLATRFVSAVLGESPYPECDPGDLLAVTFTEKAAGELAERIRRDLVAHDRAEQSRRIGDAWISTIHKMCARILRQHAFEAGIDPQFSVLDDVEASAAEVAALESAISTLVREDDDVTALLDAYGFATVVSAARQVRAGVRGLGVEIDAIATLPADEVSDTLRAAAASLKELATDFNRLRQVKTVEGNATAAQAAAALIDGMLDAEQADAEAALCALDGVRFRRLASVEGHDELVERAQAVAERAHHALAQRAVAPHERAFLRLLGAFEQSLQVMKDERGALDFEDLQTATAHLLESRPDIASSLRERFAMLMVDEFQDTDELQLAIMDGIARGNLCTVGDESQSIYAFRHADIEVFRRRARTVERQVHLRTNYRTAPALLDALNGLFAAAPLLGERHTALAAPEPAAERTPWPQEQPRFAVRFCDTTAFGELEAKEAEAECIAARVAELVASGIEPGSIAVLLGALRGGRAEMLQRALERRDIPAFLAAGGDFFECDEVAEARALLRIVHNVRDDASLATVLRGRMTGLSDDAMYALRVAADERAGKAGRRDGRLWTAATASASEVELEPADRALLSRTVETIEWVRSQRGLRPLGEIVLQALLKLDVDLALLASGARGRRAWANLMKLVRFADEYDAAAGADLGGLLDYLALREAHAASEREAVLEGESSAVRVMSIHAAKGLEFPVVVVGALDRGSDSVAISFGRASGVPLLGMRLPGEKTTPTLASERVRDIRATVASEEAVRLLYVACTRAEEALTIVARTDPGKDAGGSLGGLVRQALGCGAAGTLESGGRRIGTGSARVDVVGVEASPLADEVPTEGTCEAPPALISDETATAPRFGAPRSVSYTGLSLYQVCPYSFYATRVVRMPAPPSNEGAGALSFGVAVHAALERCTAPGALSAETIDAAAASAGLDPGELPRLRRAVDTFLASDVAVRIFAADRVLREAPIAVPVDGIVLSGAIDVIAWAGSEALVVDYKTGAGAPSAEEAEDRYRLQAACYALAALADGAPSVRVVFMELEAGQEVSYCYGAADRTAVEASIRTITDRMHAGDYAPRGTYEARSCERCPAFGSLCPVRRPAPDGAA